MIKHKQVLRLLAPKLQSWRTFYMISNNSELDDATLRNALNWGLKNEWIDRESSKKIAWKHRCRSDCGKWAYRIKD